MSTLIKMGIGLIIFLWAGATHAAPFSLVDQSTGATYQCGTGPVAPPTAVLPNTACIQTLSQYCYGHTSQNSDQCYQLAIAERGCSLAGYEPCVEQTQAYCYAHTSMNNDQCFTQALSSCRGATVSQVLLDAVAAHAEKKANDKYKLELQSLKQKANVN